ncbi:MAG: ABC transporter ATP-binding protein [Limnochordaceae bacterium]|nr:ABC transporter ATP-binding protein [Limnochordaceae bacterium]
MRRLLRYTRPYWGRMAISIALLVIVAGAGLVQPLIVQRAIDNDIVAFHQPLIRSELPAPGEPQAARRPGVIWQGARYVPVKQLPSDQQRQALSLTRYQLILGSKTGQFGGYLVQLPPGLESLPPSYTVNPLPRSSPAGPTGTSTAAESASRRAGQRDMATIRLPDGRELAAQRLTAADVALFRTPFVADVRRLAFILLGLLTISFAANYTQTYILQWTGQHIMYDLRQEIYQHLQDLALAFFDRNPTGRLVTRVTNDVEALNDMYTGLFVSLFRDAFLLAGIVIAMFGLSPYLALLALATMPLIGGVTVLFRMRVRNAYRQVRIKLARINAAMAENIAGMRVIQIFHREAAKLREFARINREYYDANMAQLLIFATFRPAIDLLSSAAVALLLWFGGVRAIAGTVTIGVLFAFINYIQQFFRPISDLTEQYNTLQTAMASAERIFQLLDTHEMISKPAKALPLPRLQGHVEFDHVWFAYHDEDWVLRDVSLEIQPGQTVALVGHTGAGKSSIISLLSRFYDIQKGSIRVDGTDIRQVDPAELRRQIAVVLQDVFLFTGNVRDNIRLGRRDIDDEQIWRALEEVGAKAFVAQLPGGLEATVTERGSTFSAGQRQLLAFARALAFDPRILVLDEATANIDTETEQLIQAALQRLSQGRTTIVIAHRLSTIQHADQIVVLHKGRVREVGTHQELLARGGLYYDLYRLQYQEGWGQEQSLAADTVHDEEGSAQTRVRLASGGGAVGL